MYGACSAAPDTCEAKKEKMEVKAMQERRKEEEDILRRI